MPVHPPIERSDVLLYLQRRRLAHWHDLTEPEHNPHPQDPKYLKRKIAALNEVCDMLREEGE